MIAMTDSKYASCNTEDFGKLIRFRIFHLVEVGGEADEVEDGGGHKDVEEHTKQLPSQGHSHLLELRSILENQSGQVTGRASKS